MSTDRREAITQALLGYLRRVEPSCVIDASTDLNSAGFLDSLAALQIRAFVEDELGTQIPDSAMTLSGFQSVNAITDLVLRYSSGPS